MKMRRVLLYVAGAVMFFAYMAGVFVLRIAMGVPLMGYSAWEVAFEVVCALVALCYLLPLKTVGAVRG